MKYLYNEFDYRLMAPSGDDESQGGTFPSETDDPSEPDKKDDSSEEGTYKAPSEAAQLAWLKRDLLNDGISEGKLKKFVELSEAVNGGGGGGGSLEFVEYTFNELPEQPDWNKLWDITDIPILTNLTSVPAEVAVSLTIENQHSVMLMRYRQEKTFVHIVSSRYFTHDGESYPSTIGDLRSNLGNEKTISNIELSTFEGTVPAEFSGYDSTLKSTMKFVFIK